MKISIRNNVSRMPGRFRRLWARFPVLDPEQ